MAKSTQGSRLRARMASSKARKISDEDFVGGFFKLIELMAGNRSWNVSEATKAGLIARWLVGGAEGAKPVSFYDEHLVYRAFALYCLKTNIDGARRFAGQDQPWYERYCEDLRELWGGRDWRGLLPQWRQQD